MYFFPSMDWILAGPQSFICCSINITSVIFTEIKAAYVLPIKMMKKSVDKHHDDSANEISSSSKIDQKLCFKITSLTTAISEALSNDHYRFLRFRKANDYFFMFDEQTTLLNHILTADHGKRIAVIENEYGEVDIDGSLVAAKSVGVEDIVMLNNGCLCCTVRGDLVRMIGELVNKKKGKFDHIVIETTGLANPAPITLVDAKHANIHLDDIKPEGVVNEAIEQIAYADSEDKWYKPDGKNFLSISTYLDYVLGIGGFDLERIDDAIENEASKEDHRCKSANADTISQQPQGKSNKIHKGKKRNKKKKNRSGLRVMDINRFVLETCRRRKRTKVLPDMECSWLSSFPCSYRPSKRDISSLLPEAILFSFEEGDSILHLLIKSQSVDILDT
ncbi:hypothetical protein LXL04_002846 [Taraxacum kok-saghyz]